jgi:hypothetical protein
MKKIYSNIFVVYVLLSGCSNNYKAPLQYTYCPVAHISDPTWVQRDRDENHLIAKIGVKHNRDSERDIRELVKSTLAKNLSSDAHAYSQSVLDNSSRLVTNYNVNVATNVQLKNVKTEFEKIGDCLVAWASISQNDAQIALTKSHPINQKEHASWLLISSSHDIKDYKHHLRLYPQGLYTETAKARIDVLNKHYAKRAFNRSVGHPTARMLGNLLDSFFN